jgi:hypothetical protein
MQRNPGHCPDEADGTDEGKTFYVHVRLFGGYSTEEAGHAPWPATGRGACDWRISRPPHPFQIEYWELVR